MLDSQEEDGNFILFEEPCGTQPLESPPPDSQPVDSQPDPSPVEAEVGDSQPISDFDDGETLVLGANLVQDDLDSPPENTTESKPDHADPIVTDIVNDSPTNRDPYMCSGEDQKEDGNNPENNEGGDEGEGEGEEEEGGSDDELCGFMCLENDGSITTHGAVSPYTVQLMNAIQNMMSDSGNPSMSSSSLQPAMPNPGSRAARRAARNQRLRRMRKKGGK